MSKVFSKALRGFNRAAANTIIASPSMWGCGSFKHTLVPPVIIKPSHMTMLEKTSPDLTEHFLNVFGSKT